MMVRNLKVMVRLDDAEYDLLSQIAEEDGRSRSGWLRYQLQKEIVRRAKAAGLPVRLEWTGKAEDDAANTPD